MESKLGQLKSTPRYNAETEKQMFIIERSTKMLKEYKSSGTEDTCQLTLILTEVLNMLREHVEEFTKEIELIRATGLVRYAEFIV